MKKTIEEMIDELAGKEIRYIQIDGALSTIQENYNVTNAVILNMIYYSHLIAFAFFEEKEAVEMVDYLLKGYSSYELDTLANSVLQTSLVEFYKGVVYLDHSISSNPMIKALEAMSLEVEDSFENLDSAYEKLEELVPKDKK